MNSKLSTFFAINGTFSSCSSAYFPLSEEIIGKLCNSARLKNHKERLDYLLMCSAVCVFIILSYFTLVWYLNKFWLKVWTFSQKTTAKSSFEWNDWTGNFLNSIQFVPFIRRIFYDELWRCGDDFWWQGTWNSDITWNSLNEFWFLVLFKKIITIFYETFCFVV